jgi:Barstar (barnase inhibitor)
MDLMALREASRSLKRALFRINGDEVRLKASLLDALASARAFPDYFGRNWDAFDECITDLSWWQARGFVLVFERADRLLAHALKDFKTFSQIAADASISRYSEGTPFHIIVSSASTVVHVITRTVGEGVCNHQL